jgi:aminoglycoside phosphotransferase (APT) family kinase protein
MAAGVPGTLVGAGRSADVYDIGDGRVLRRYRDGREPTTVENEAQVMAHARSCGVPVPEVFDVSGPDIVMERATGPTMLDVLASRPWTVRAQATLLARLHGLVHRVPAGDLPLRAPYGDPEDGDVLLHRDLHPLNVILTADGPKIIDWEGAARGPAVADAAMTWVIVKFSDVPGSRVKVIATTGVQGAFTRAFLRAAGPVDESWRLIAVRHRLTDHNLLPSEAARLKRLVPASSAAPTD